MYQFRCNKDQELLDENVGHVFCTENKRNDHEILEFVRVKAVEPFKENVHTLF